MYWLSKPRTKGQSAAYSFRVVGHRGGLGLKPLPQSFEELIATVALPIIAAYTYGRSARTPLSSGLSHHSRGGGTGRRAGFKIRFLKGSASSILAPGTTNTNGSSPFSVFWTLGNTARIPSAHLPRIVSDSESTNFKLLLQAELMLSQELRSREPECPLSPKADIRMSEIR